MTKHHFGSLHPITPNHAVDVSFGYRLKMTPVLWAAKIFGFWDKPYWGATDFAEMNWKDVYYWVYKTTNPITRPEKDVNIRELITADSSIVKLPGNFESKTSVTFGTCGDMLYPQGPNGNNSPLGLENSKDILFENVADLLFDQDISLVNFESPVTTQPLEVETISNRAAPVECCSREQFNILKGHKGKNFTIMNTANNHTFDLGIEGMESTQRALDEEGILNLGVNASPEQRGKALIIERNGIKIGFVSVTFGMNGRVLPNGEEYRINQSRILSKIVDVETDLLELQINDCKAQDCDFIIGVLHWGFEFEFFPRKKQIDASHKLIEMGLDSIVSCHAHVIQPVEYYRTKRDPNRVAVIAYSLGSLTWGYSAPFLALSLILNLKLTKGILNWKVVTYLEHSNVTQVFRSSIKNAGKIETRIEKLEAHLSGKNRAHALAYIEEIKRYADLIKAGTI